MQQRNSGMSCQVGSWALAAGVGLLVLVLLLVIGDWAVMAAIFMAGLAFLVLGGVFSWLFCRDLPAPRGPGNIDTSKARDTSAPAPKTAAPAAPATSSPTAAESPAPSSTVEVVPPSESAPSSADALPDVRTASASADAEAGAQVKPSTRLAGEEDLASRKGEWKYDGESGTSAAAAPTSAAMATPDGDKSGATEGGAEGSKPETLSAAREGGPDNLKEIKGVGPKLEQLLHSMGFYHFDQIANWTPDEVAWVDDNLQGFKGRVTRDNWVAQAKTLADGGDTEFSKRVGKGDVY